MALSEATGTQPSYSAEGRGEKGHQRGEDGRKEKRGISMALPEATADSTQLLRGRERKEWTSHQHSDKDYYVHSRSGGKSRRQLPPARTVEDSATDDVELSTPQSMLL